MAIKSSRNSILLINQTLNELKFNINYLLEESFKHTNNNLFIYCLNPSSTAGNNNNKNLPKLIDKFQFKTIIKQFYQSSFKLNPGINVNCLLPITQESNEKFLIKNSLNHKYGYFYYDSILTDINHDNQIDESILQNFIQEFLPHFKCDLSKPIVHKIDCSSNIQTYDTSNLLLEEITDEDLIAKDKIFDNSILGGTFDRLHIGHKIMLTEAALLTKHKLLIGISDRQLLASKKLSELIEDINIRSESVMLFLYAIAPHLDVETVPINDKFGPSTVEKNYQCLIVSQETAKGGESVNQERIKNNLPPLEIHVIGLIKDNIDLSNNQIDEDEDKVSSSNERKHLLGTLLKPPYIAYNPSKPYIIGLTGGLASGKSNIRKDLENLGAASIDCDKMGHKAYEKDTQGYQNVIDTFGNDILDDNGNIDRKKLGKIVFGKPNELKKLNEIVWPEIKNLTNKEINRLYNIEGKKIIVIEAAVLFEAKWEDIMNEIWVCFIPDEEAIKRSIERDNSNEEKAKQILKSQIPNSEKIKKANVVFCSLWKREYTMKQVKKAWLLLNERLK